MDGSVRFERREVYDLAREEEPYDLVLFMGVFYHLRYPLLGLDLVARLVRRLLLFQTMTMPGWEVREEVGDRPLDQRDAWSEPGWPKMAFIEREHAGDPTNWWAADHAAGLALLRSTGMEVVERPAHEVYACRPAAPADEADRALRRTWIGQMEAIRAAFRERDDDG